MCKAGFAPDQDGDDPQSFNSTLECVACTSGKAKSGIGSHPCHTCEAGKYANEDVAAIDCSECVAGKFLSVAGLCLEVSIGSKGATVLTVRHTVYYSLGNYF
jgi:hypothetical protein